MRASLQTTTTSVFAPESRFRMNLMVVAATACTYVLRHASNPIQLIRALLAPVLQLGAFELAYNISGQTAVPASQVIGFLVIGIFMTEAWSATIWGSGNALDAERHTGTISAVVAAPASTVAVILGHTEGSLLTNIPSIASCTIVGLLAGASFDLGSPLAAIVALITVYLCTFTIGLAFGGLFILTRNSISNFLQLPIFLIVGIWALGKADRAIRRSGTLDIL